MQYCKPNLSLFVWCHQHVPCAYITKSRFHVTEVISSSIINNWVWARIGLQECFYSWELNESIARALSSLSKFCKRDKGSGNYSSAEPTERYFQRGGIHPRRSPIYLKAVLPHRPSCNLSYNNKLNVNSWLQMFKSTVILASSPRCNRKWHLSAKIENIF